MYDTNDTNPHGFTLQDCEVLLQGILDVRLPLPIFRIVTDAWRRECANLGLPEGTNPWESRDAVRACAHVVTPQLGYVLLRLRWDEYLTSPNMVCPRYHEAEILARWAGDNPDSIAEWFGEIPIPSEWANDPGVRGCAHARFDWWNRQVRK